MNTSHSAQSRFPFLGFGVGLRHQHFSDFLNRDYRDVEWVEVISENFIPWKDGRFRRPINTLRTIRRDLPVALHGVSMNLGSAEKLDEAYLQRLQQLINEIEPCWVSDHLCWTGIDSHSLHDLLPLPYTRECATWVAERILRVQDFIKRPLLIENVSSYAEFADQEMTEGEFVSAVAEQADCGILLDINNIYVSSRNHQIDPIQYLQTIPWSRVGQIHLAGHTDLGTHVIDTHDEAVCDEVWKLYQWVATNRNPVSTMIERDDNIPTWPKLAAEVRQARSLFESAKKGLKRGETGHATATL